MSDLKLHKYQETAIEFALKHKASYMAMDMGLGKTAVSLYWSREVLKTTKGVLVMAPLRTIHSTWPDEINKWTPELTYTIMHGTNKDYAITEKRDLYLINYEGLAWLFDKLKSIFKATGTIPFRAIILDEGSMLKSPSTKRFKMLRKLRDIFPEYRLILSGTPAPNSMLDLWSQYFFLDGGLRLGKAFTYYKQEFFMQIDHRGFVWAIRPGSKETIYESIGDITYRLDAKDYLDMPECIYNKIKIKLTKKQRAQYDELEKKFFLELSEDVTTEVFNAASLSMKLRQFLQGALYIDDQRNYEILHKEKIKALKSLVEEAGGQGILCAIQFRFELEMILKVYPDTPVIAGGTKASDAAKYIKQWNEGKIPLLLCHPASLSHGVNLQTGSHIILWYGLTWSLEQYLQLNARLYRQGQRKAVIIHHLLVENSVDEKVFKALKAKFRTQSELLDYLKGLR